jgi:hypothetical protein
MKPMHLDIKDGYASIITGITPMILTEVQWNGNMRGNEGIELLDFQNKRK